MSQTALIAVSVTYNRYGDLFRITNEEQLKRQEIRDSLRCPHWHGGGRWFESTRAYQIYQTTSLSQLNLSCCIHFSVSNFLSPFL